MATHRHVQQIANLSQRKKRWWREARSQVTLTLPVLIVALPIVSWVLGYLADWASAQEGVQPDALIFFVLNYSFIERIVLMLPIGLLLSIPLVVAAAGRYPSKRDVLRDQALRRAFGMPDEIASETDD